MKIGVIHATANAVAPLMEEFGKAEEPVQILNYVNENLLLTVNEHGVDSKALRMFARLVFEVAEAGVDGILVACSVFCRYIPFVRPFVTVPVIGIDRPMLEKAVRCGHRLGVVATTATAAPVSRGQLEEIAKNLGKEISVEEEIITEAMTQLRNRNTEKHNAIIADACHRLEEKGCDTILLCQITMACAAESISLKKAELLTSPAEGVREILRLCRER